ncbi:tetratricopeptide repeat protein [Hymenobacter sp. DG01]|uniref:tetratricopeptide repeat protein n=1 Tax=Hymenobacter sp. DG01 TaxID=2584940 RepID=UPI00112360F5|nr:tetratricopeptide repeat protein [Hymenobacter sp. DG01]
MKNIVVGSLLLLSTWGSLTRIHDRNEAIQQGADAYARGNYRVAAAAYKRATLSLGARDEAVWLNLAHATARAGQAAEARGYYSRLVTSKEPVTRSVALQQLGVLAAAQQDYAQAVGLLRQALVANPTNADARFNYEVLRTFLAQRAPTPPPPGTNGGSGPRKPGESAPQPRPGADNPGEVTDPTQQQDPRATPQTRPDAAGQTDPNRPSSSPSTSAEGSFRPGQGPQRNMAQGNEPGAVRGLSDSDTGAEAATGASRRGGTEAAANAEANIQTQRARLQQLNLSTGQARQILEALHAAEQQYLQQLPRKAAQPQPKGKPGW